MNNNAHTNSSLPFVNPEEEGLTKVIRDDDGDFDNYWNKEGTFEYESDKYDETLEDMDQLGESNDPTWKSEQRGI